MEAGRSTTEWFSKRKPVFINLLTPPLAQNLYDEAPFRLSFISFYLFFQLNHLISLFNYYFYFISFLYSIIIFISSYLLIQLFF